MKLFHYFQDFLLCLAGLSRGPHTYSSSSKFLLACFSMALALIIHNKDTIIMNAYMPAAVQQFIATYNNDAILFKRKIQNVLSKLYKGSSIKLDLSF